MGGIVGARIVHHHLCCVLRNIQNWEKICGGEWIATATPRHRVGPRGGGLLRLPHVQAVTRSHTGQTAPHGHASATLGQCGRMARTRPRQAIHGARHGHARPGQGEAPAGIMAQRKAPPVRAGLG